MTSWLICNKMAGKWLSFLAVVLPILLVTDAAVNLARGKPANSSSIETGEGGGPAELAVDGNTSTEIHTLAHRRSAWWEVDLQTRVTNARIVVYFRTIWPYRRPGLKFFTSQRYISFFSDPGVELIHTTTGTYTTIPDVYPIDTTGEWRYLVIYTATNYSSVGAALDFKEIEVWACPEGLYGNNCADNCNSRGCQGESMCPYATGKCDNGCQTGFDKADCSECVYGHYGTNCDRNCTDRNCADKEASCSRFNFTCTCAAGWMGQHCAALCKNATYGVTCKRKCSQRKCTSQSSTCDRFTGVCPDGCKAGYQLPDCTQSCPQGTYGPGCSSVCGICLNETVCDHVTGLCPEGCREGFKRSLCVEGCPLGKYGPGCNSVCGNCLNGTVCDHVTGLCPEGCRKGFKPDLCVAATDTLNVDAIIGGGIAVLVVAVVVVVAVVNRQKRQKQKGQGRPAEHIKDDSVYYDVVAEEGTTTSCTDRSKNSNVDDKQTICVDRNVYDHKLAANEDHVYDALEYPDSNSQTSKYSLKTDSLNACDVMYYNVVHVVKQ